MHRILFQVLGMVTADSFLQEGPDVGATSRSRGSMILPWHRLHPVRPGRIDDGSRRLGGILQETMEDDTKFGRIHRFDQCLPNACLDNHLVAD